MATTCLDTATTETRVCRACGIPKSVNDFSARGDVHGGFRASCRRCRGEVDRRRRFRRRHSQQHAVLRRLADSVDDGLVVKLAGEIVRRAKGCSAAAEELWSIASLEFERGKYRGRRGMRGVGRLLAVAARVQLRQDDDR
jgi:hypothetical protein